MSHKRLGCSKTRQLEVLLCDTRYANCFEIFLQLRSVFTLDHCACLCSSKVILYTNYTWQSMSLSNSLDMICIA